MKDHLKIKNLILRSIYLSLEIPTHGGFTGLQRTFQIIF